MRRADCLIPKKRRRIESCNFHQSQLVMGKNILALYVLLGLLTLSYASTNNTESSTSVTSSVTTVSKRVIAKSFRRVNSTSAGTNGTVETPVVTDEIPVSLPNLEKIEKSETNVTEETDETVKPQKLKKKILASNLKNVNEKIILTNDKTEKHSILKPAITTTDKTFFKDDNTENLLNSTEIMKDIILKKEKENKFERQERNRTDGETIKEVESSMPRAIEARSFEETSSNDNVNHNLRKVLKTPTMVMEQTTNVNLNENFEKVKTSNTSERYNETVSVANSPVPIISGRRLTPISRDNTKKNSITFNNDFAGPNQTDWVPIIPDYQIIRPSPNGAPSFGNKVKFNTAVRLNRTTERQPIVFPSNEQQNSQTRTESNVISFQDTNAKRTVVRHKNNIEKPLSASDETKTFTINSQSGRLPIKFRGAVKYKSNQNQTSQNSSEEEKKSQNETILKKGNFSLDTLDVNIPAAGGSLVTPNLKGAPPTITTNKLPETTEISVVVTSSSNTTKKSTNSIDDGVVIPPEHMKFENISKKQEQPLANNVLTGVTKNLPPVGQNGSEPVDSKSNADTIMTTVKNPDFMNLTEVIFPGSVSRSETNKTSPDLQIPKVMANEVETTSIEVTSEGLVTSASTSNVKTPRVNVTSTTEKLKLSDVSSQSSISDSSVEKMMELPDKMKIMLNGSHVTHDNLTTLTSVDLTSTPSLDGVMPLTTLKPTIVEEIEAEEGPSTEIESTTKLVTTTTKRIDEVKKVYVNISSSSPPPIFTSTRKPLQILNGTSLNNTSTTTSKNFKTSTRQTTTTPTPAFTTEYTTKSTTKSTLFPITPTIPRKASSTHKVESEATSTISNVIVDKAITELPSTILLKTTVTSTKSADIIMSNTTPIPSNFTPIRKTTAAFTSSTSTTSHSIPTTSGTTPRSTTILPLTSSTLTSSTTTTEKTSSPSSTAATTTTTTTTAFTIAAVVPTEVPTVGTSNNKNVINTDKPQEGIYYKDYVPSTINPHFEITEENVPAYLRLTVEALSWAELCNLKEDLHDAIIRMLGGSSNVSSESVHFLNLNEKNCQEKIEKTKSQETNQTVFLPVNMFLMDKKGDFDKNLSEAFLTSWGRQGLDFELPIRKVDFVTPIVNLTELAEPPLGGSVVAAIVISCVAGLCVIMLGVLFVIMKRRQKRFNYGQRCTPVSLDAYSLDSVSIYNSVRRKGMRASKRSYGNAAFDDPEVPTHPMNFAGLANFSTDKEQLYEEFNIIPQVNPKVEELPEGAEKKNRYANVIPLPETRVHLSKIDGDPLSDYINANYIRGPKGVEKLYIACQAPMESTIQDFWRMVWEEQCKVILMITDLQENGIEKCADYLPPNEVTDNIRLFGDFQVTLKKRDVKEKYIISHLKLKNMEANLWREVVHLWYLGWPDQGVPSEASSMIAFLIEARSQMKMQNGATTASPSVVHCSPGTGRTGTVIACDLCIREYEQSRLVDIPKCVYNLRRDRAGAVQTKDQYAFIYQVLNVYATKLSGGGIESI